MSDYDVIVIGGGPAGYPAAIRAGQNGLKVACIDEWKNYDGSATFGGTCLNAGCIPSKALLESSELFHRAQAEFASHGIKTGPVAMDIAAMQKRKAGIVKNMTGGIVQLLKAAGVTAMQGHGKLLAGRKVEFTAHDGSVKTFSAKHVVLASGSQPTPLKTAAFDGKHIVDSWGALEFDAVPKRLGVIGAGVIGLELGSVWRRLGADVVVLEAMPGFLASYTDEAGASHSLNVDKLVVCIGRRPHTANLLGEGTGVVIDERGFIKVDDHCHTGVENVWAVGDCVRGPMLAHKGKEEGVAVADRIAGLYAHVNYETIPSVIYTAPEIAWVGQTEEQVKASGRPYKVGSFPFLASGRARAMEASQGFAKLIAAKDDDQILGVHIIGPMAGELIAEAVLAMEYSASAEDLQRTIHAHPTLSEALHEAALAADKRAIDMPNR